MTATESEDGTSFPPLYELRNPVTLSTVRFTEPFRYRTMAQHDSLVEAFNAWCDRMWSGELGGQPLRCDPLVVDPNAVWGGSEDLIRDPAAALRNAVRELAAQFGIFALNGEVGRQLGVVSGG